MYIIPFLFALFYAIILTLLLVTLFGSVGDWKSSWPLFIIILFSAVAAGLWVVPIGPALWGFYYLPTFIVALIFALLLAITMPGRNKKKANEKTDREEVQKNITPTTYYSPHAAEPQKGVYRGEENIGTVVMGGFFWVIIILLSFIIIAGILMEPAY